MMRLRLKAYLQSPFGIWCRFRRDVPCLLKGTSYYESCRGKDSLPKLPVPNDDAVKAYWSERKQHPASAVIYTCITGGYDRISRIACPSAVNGDCDYVCFTDSERDVRKGRIGVWSMRPLSFDRLDNTRNNRWHKTHPHLLFPEYEESIYMDANINILKTAFVDSLRLSSRKMAIPRHPLRDCVYDEFANAFAEFMDSPNAMWQERCMIRKSGMPRHYGLTENNILYRKHRDGEIIAIMEAWWNTISEYSKRDQLSLAWILWKHNIPISAVSFPHWYDAPGTYCVLPHERQTTLSVEMTSTPAM